MDGRTSHVMKKASRLPSLYVIAGLNFCYDEQPASIIGCAKSCLLSKNTQLLVLLGKLLHCKPQQSSELYWTKGPHKVEPKCRPKTLKPTAKHPLRQDPWCNCWQAIFFLICLKILQHLENVPFIFIFSVKRAYNKKQCVFPTKLRMLPIQYLFPNL